MGAARTFFAFCFLAATQASLADVSFPRDGLRAGTAKASVEAGGVVRHSLDVDRAPFEASTAGQVVWLPGTGGTPLAARFERFRERGDGHWSWIGKVDTVAGPQSVVVTFGPDAVFATIPQASGPALRVETRGGKAWLVEGDVPAARPPSGRSDGLATPAEVPLKRAGARAEMVRDPKLGDVPLVDVLVVYTPGLVTSWGSVAAVETRIAHLESLSNQAYSDSDAGAEIRVVAMRQVNYPEVTIIDKPLSDMWNPDNLPIKVEVDGLRNQFGADLVAMLRSVPETLFDGTCGIAYIGGSRGNPYTSTRGYSVTLDNASSLGCPEYTFTHELGHNFGSDHDAATISEGGGTFAGHFPYSRGHKASGFGTIMAYLDASQTRYGLLSNPRLSTCLGQACGVADFADNARSHTDAAATLSAYYPTVVPVLPKLYIDNARVVEGDAGTRVASFTIRLSKASATAISFDISTADISAAAGVDYVSRAATDQVIPAGQLSTTFAVTINGDTTDEGPEEFSVTLANVSGVKLGDGRAIGTIDNDDTTLAIGDQTVPEGDGGSQLVNFSVQLSVPTVNDVVFDFATADATATAGSDYVGRSLAARVIPAGETRLDFGVVVNGDLDVEPEETFNVVVSSLSGAKPGDTAAVGTIQRDDTSISVDDVALVEGNAGTREAVFTVTALYPPAKPLSFRFSTADGSARAGSDYIAVDLPGSSFGFGQTTQVFSVPVSGDTTVEPDETFLVRLDEVVGASVTDGEGQGTIYADDDASALIRTLAGGGLSAENGILATRSSVSAQGIAVDAAGNVYISDKFGNQVRKVTPEGVISVFAGTGVSAFGGDGGLAVAASLHQPAGLAVGADGSVYIADAANQRIRRVGPDGRISTYAGGGPSLGDGGPAGNAQLSYPTGVAVGPDGSVYIADYSFRRIRRVTPGGIISTFAGGNTGQLFGGDGGPAELSSLAYPRDVAVDGLGRVYISDTDNHRVRWVDGQGVIRTLAGTGVAGFGGDGGDATQALLNKPEGIAVDADGNVYVADSLNRTVRRISRRGVITTVAGNGAVDGDLLADGAIATSARLGSVIDVAIGPGGDFLLAENNARVRRVGRLGLPDAPGIGIASAGDATATVSFTPPADNGGAAIVGYLVESQPMGGVDADAYRTGGSHRITGLQNGTGYRFTVRAVNEFGIGDASEPSNLVTPVASALPLLSIADAALLEGTSGNRTLAFTISLNRAADAPVVFDIATADQGASAGSDYTALSLTARQIPAGQSQVTLNVSVLGDAVAESDETFVVRVSNVTGATVIDGEALGTVSDDDLVSKPINTVAGNGSGVAGNEGDPALSVGFPQLRDLVLDREGNQYVLDYLQVRRISALGQVTTVAGTGVSGTAGDGGLAVLAQLKSPQAIALDPLGNLYIADDRRIRKVATNGFISTVAGGGSQGSCASRDLDPARVAIQARAMVFDGVGNLYLSDTCGVLKLAPSGRLQRIAGVSTTGYSGDGGLATQAQFNGTEGMVFDPAGNLLVADRLNSRIRRITPGGVVDTLLADYAPTELAIDADGYVYFSFPGTQRIYRRSPGGGVIAFAGNGSAGFSGDGGPAILAQLYGPTALALDGAGNLYIAESTNRRIRRVGDAGVPAAPVIGTAVAGNGQATLSFSPPSSDGGSPVTGYRVYSSPAGGVDADAGGNSLSRVITGLQNGTSYRFFVRASNAVGTGPASALSNAVTPSAAALPLLTVDDVVVTEGNSSGRFATFILRLSSPAPAGGVGYAFATANGSATAGSDYTARSLAGQLIPAGGVSASVQVTVSGDTTVEPNEDFLFTVSGVTGATVQRGQARATVLNDDGPTLSVADLALDEGQDGDRAANFEIRLSQVAASDVEVDAATVDGSARAGSDYGARSGRVRIPAGQLAATFPVQVSGDLTVEPNEAFGLRLANASGASIADGQAIATVRNDDQVTRSFSVADVELAEGDSGVRFARFTLRLSEAASAETSVTAFTIDGSAQAGSDYTARQATTLVFAPGQTRLNFDVAVSGDTVAEADEHFFVYLANPVGGVVSDGQAFGRIRNDESRLVVEDMTVLEGGTNRTLQVMIRVLGAVPAAPISFDARTVDGSAQAAVDVGTGQGADFTANGPVGLVIPTGATSVSFPVAVPANFDPEGDESFFVAIDNVLGALVEDGEATVTLLNDDSAQLTLSLVYGDGTAVLLDAPTDVAFDAAGNAYYADSFNYRVLRRSITGTVDVVAGNGFPGTAGDGGPATAANVRPHGVAVDAAGNLFISEASQHRIRRVGTDGTITTFAGSPTGTDAGSFAGDGGPAAEARFNVPTGLEFDAEGNLYVADRQNHRIRRIDTLGIVTTVAGNGTAAFAGDGGPAVQGALLTPSNVSVGADRSLYIADEGNYRLRKVAPDGTLTTLAGNGSQSTGAPAGAGLAADTGLFGIRDVVPDGHGNLLLAADDQIFKLTPAGVLITIAGTATAGYSEGSPATARQMNLPMGLEMHKGELYFADLYNRRIRRLSVRELPSPPASVTASAGNAQATVVFPASLVQGSSPVTGYWVSSYPAGGVDPDAGGTSLERVVTGLQNGTTYTFSVLPRSAAGYGSRSPASNPVTPSDGNQPTLRIGDVTIDEGDSGNRSASFTVRLSKASPEPVRFSLATAPGSASAGSDYSSLVLVDEVISPGYTSATFAVAVRGDTTIEADETFQLNLSAVEGAVLADGQGIATIRNDDQVRLSVADVSLAEGNSGTRLASFVVKLSHPAPAPVTFSVATRDISATAGSDYVARSLAGQVIATGASTAVFAVTVNGDLLQEADESFGVDVSGVSGALVSDGQAIGTLLNDDSEPPPVLSIGDAAIDEGNTGSRTLSFTISLSKPAPATVSYAIATANGTASAGSDYVARALAGQSIAAGASGASFAVTVNGDTAVESDETFTVSVTGVGGATVGDGQATGTIRNDDSAALPVLATRADRFVLRENAPAVDLAVLGNDVFDAARLATGSLVVTGAPALGTATVPANATVTAADDRIRYTPPANATGEAVIGYRLCESGGRCVNGEARVLLRPVLDVNRATTSGAGFFDLPVTGLRALPAAGFAATPLVAAAVSQPSVGTDASLETPWDAGRRGTTTWARSLAAPANGQPQAWRILVDARGLAGDLDLYLGEDSNGDGQATADELRCTAAMSTVSERCELSLQHPGTGTVRYWIMAHNRHAAVQSARLEAFAVPVSATDGSLVATGPGQLPAAAAFPLRLAFSDYGQLTNEARLGYVRVRTGGVDTGLFPVRLDRTGTTTPPLALASGVARSLRLAAGTAQDRIFIDVPAGASSLTVTTTSAQNVDLYLARAATPSSPGIDPAPARAAAQASAVGASGNETLVVSGGALVPGRWYVTPVNPGAAVASLSLQATVTGAAPVVRSGSYFNGARGGHGLFLYPAGGSLAGLWYTYFQDGTPTWYYLQGLKPGANGMWNATLYRSASSGAGNTLTAIGEAKLSPTGPDAFQFSYTLDGETGSESLGALGRGCPNLSGAPLDVSSHWFNPAKAGSGYSVQMFANYEFYSAFVYDGRGVARFLLAERNGFGGADATVPLVQLNGYCPLCTRVNPTRQDIGTFSRRFAAGSFANISLDGIFVGGVPGTWTGDESVQLLGGAGTSQGCQP